MSEHFPRGMLQCACAGESRTASLFRLLRHTYHPQHWHLYRNIVRGSTHGSPSEYNTPLPPPHLWFYSLLLIA
jgi:hypothetical protein